MAVLNSRSVNLAVDLDWHLDWQHKIHMSDFELDIAPVTPNWFLFLPNFTPFNPRHYFPPRWLNQIPRSHCTRFPLQIQIVRCFSIFYHLLQNTLQQCYSVSEVFTSYFTLNAFTHISLTSAPTQLLLRSLTVVSFILSCSSSTPPLQDAPWEHVFKWSSAHKSPSQLLPEDPVPDDLEKN